MKKNFLLLGLTGVSALSACAFMVFQTKKYTNVLGSSEYRTIVLDKDTNFKKGLAENEELKLINDNGTEGGTFAYECGTFTDGIEFSSANYYYIVAYYNNESEADFGMKFTFNIKGLRSISIVPYGVTGFNFSGYNDKGELVKSIDMGDEGLNYTAKETDNLCKGVFTMSKTPIYNTLLVTEFKITYFVDKCLILSA